MEIYTIIANIGCYLFFAAGLLQLGEFITKKVKNRKENKK